MVSILISPVLPSWSLSRSKSCSEVMDIPAFPSDDKPKILSTSVDVEWIPWIGGVCWLDDGSPLLLAICSKTGSSFFDIWMPNEDLKYSGRWDMSGAKYVDGVIYIGSMPRLTVNIVTHEVILNISEEVCIQFKATFRGPPLWYGKTVDVANMLCLSQDPIAYIGGYDGPVEIEGTITSYRNSVNFSGYGNWEHVWLLGIFRSRNVDRRWMFFNDDAMYGVVIDIKDKDTGETLIHAGRIGDGKSGRGYTFDDFEWTDDGRRNPSYIRINGTCRNLAGKPVAYIDLETIAKKSAYFTGPWTVHKMKGTASYHNFNGIAFSEVYKVR